MHPTIPACRRLGPRWWGGGSSSLIFRSHIQINTAWTVLATNTYSRIVAEALKNVIATYTKHYGPSRRLTARTRRQCYNHIYQLYPLTTGTTSSSGVSFNTTAKMAVLYSHQEEAPEDRAVLPRTGCAARGNGILDPPTLQAYLRALQLTFCYKQRQPTGSKRFPEPSNRSSNKSTTGSKYPLPALSPTDPTASSPRRRTPSQPSWPPASSSYGF